MTATDKIISGYEVQRFGQGGGYGEWTPLSESRWELQEEVIEEVVHDDSGHVFVGGQAYRYRAIQS
jgi:hypothetical protein